jgi:spore coat polysaccharide biosynthesis protein SpsF (cytidylyltransferase family)/aryl-alcohol dehydrogenase-like predicted oxidoreductase
LTSIVVIQARTNSKRLPAKALLPVAGLPTVVLAARRAGNTNKPVIVATSTEPSDDCLVRTLKSHGIRYFRGSLDNTLERFNAALKEFGDDTLVFRLTADNILPDGKLLDEIEEDFISKNLDYLACNGIESGLPYGLSVELTRLKHLRCSLEANPSQSDAEHVTPAIIRKFGRSYFTKYLSQRLGQYRCTIDGLDDYLNLERLFADVNDPIGESSLALANKLKTLPGQPIIDRPATKLVLGTAQLGSNYGIANKTGVPEPKTSEIIIKTSIENGVRSIDTAQDYGTSEMLLGSILTGGWENRVSIITKLSPLRDLPTDADNFVTHRFVDSSVFNSLYCLKARRLDTLLLHRPEHLTRNNGEIWNRLLTHKHEGRIETLGVSIQNPAELELALKFKEVEHIQLPINILDWRWQVASGLIEEIKQQRKLIVHARSVYLQGLLISDDPNVWNITEEIDGSRIQEWLKNLTKSFKRKSVSDLCVAFVNTIPWIDGVVIGMETIEQLQKNLHTICRKSLLPEQVDYVLQTRPAVSSNSLDPSTWRQKSA